MKHCMPNSLLLLSLEAYKADIKWILAPLV
jgi:hypothetical protein